MVLLSGALAAGWAGVRPLTLGREATARNVSWSSVSSVRYPADSLVAVIVTRGLFRSTGQPAAVAYDPSRVLLPEAASMPKPVLTLVGLVAGEPPSAVIEGFPGVEGGRVVRIGDVVAALRVTGIDAEQVTITGMDTTWVLRIREPWK